MYLSIFYFILLIYYIIGLIIYMGITHTKIEVKKNNIININDYNELLIS